MNSTRNYKYYDWLMAAFVAVLLCSSLIGTGKVSEFHGLQFGSAVIFFPLSYIFGDVLTEVYGYAHSRRVVWAGFGALIFAAFMCMIVVGLPPAANWPHQHAYEIVYGSAPRIVFGSLIAFFAGEFSNSYVLAKMKVWSNGKYLWLRTIGSTIVGEAVDSLIFYPIAFLGVWPQELVAQVMISNYGLKVMFEVVMTPFTYKIVQFLKKHENEDYYDYKTNFNPFAIKTRREPK